MSEVSWSFSFVWNRSLEQREERKLKPRQHVWASELGGAMIDRYLKMNAVEPSNPFDSRSLRKFEAGRFFEWIVEMVLTRAGILISKQDWVDFQYPGLLKVTGKMDHLAGGKPDYEKARSQVETEFLPEFIKRASLAVVNYFAGEYPNGLKPIAFEIKSVGSLIFHRYDTRKIADTKHALQLYHYLKGTGLPEGHIVYVSKDDLCLVEIGVFAGQMEDAYKKDIETITGHLRANQEPPSEPEIVFDEIGGRFASNWKIAYSPYLTRVYGFKNQAEFDAKNKPLVGRWNRVLGRIAEGKSLTADNKSALKDMQKLFPNLDELLKFVKVDKEVENESNS